MIWYLQLSCTWTMGVTRTVSLWSYEPKVQGKEYSPGLPRWSICVSFSLFLCTALRRKYLHLIKTKQSTLGQRQSSGNSFIYYQILQGSLYPYIWASCQLRLGARYFLMLHRFTRNGLPNPVLTCVPQLFLSHIKL